MIDIHSHILPALDDGAKNVEESIALITQAINDGITHIVTTPHIHLGRYDNTIDNIYTQFYLLQQYVASKNLDVKLAMAAEVRVDVAIIDLIENKRIPYLGKYGKNNCVLLEFPHSHMPPGYDNFITWLGEKNITVIVAHPERNRDIQQDISYLNKLKKLGCLLQVTASSITGDFGQRAFNLCEIILKYKLADFVASDAHNVKRRPAVLSKAYQFICNHYGEAYATALLYTNPRCLTDALFQKYN
ncbi:capsule biosynthesis protein CapC [Pseudoalteromonas sp. MMG010]|nr:capsule biosynthesis protein CapC [Pseudoalteromonas sp. MMG010]